MELIVTRADNSNYNLPSENSKITSAVQTRTLMGEDTVVMTVQSVGYINFIIGDWIEVFGRKYTLNTLGEPQRIGENTFEYNLVFEGVNYELTKVVYRSADYSGFNPTSDFPLSGTAKAFLTVLQYNLERAFGQGIWAIGSFPATEAKTLSFTSENCLLALNRVCSEFGLEYEIKTIGGVKTINLGAVGDTLPLTLEYGKGKGLYSLTRTNVDSKNIVTRLYVEGSDRNVKAGYRDNALRLRIASNAESYIDSSSVASFGIIEGSKIFEDIFPHREGTVSAINASDVLEFTDSSMDFDLAEADSNGTKWLIAGQSAKIHFNTGALAGYEFELTSYNHTTKTFKIKPFKDERGLQFPNPDSAAFQIKTGDKYVILDIIMPDAYIQAAEAELLAWGQEYLSQNDQPRVEYSLDLDRFFLKSMFSGPGFDVNFLDAGDYLHIKDFKIGVDKEVRVKTFTRDVIDPWVYQVALSDVIEPTRIELLLADTLETKKAARQSKLFDPARSRRNWRDVEEVAGMVDTLRAEVALIGSPEGQFQLDSFFEVNKGGNPDSFGATAGVLAHNAFEGDAGSIWNIGAFDVALSNSGAYYLYAQCSRVNTGAVFTVSLTKIEVDSDPAYYHFPVGLISSKRDNSRTLTTTYGYTLISGNNISTGIIKNENSGLMINLETGDIQGKFKFTSGVKIEDAITDQQIYVEYSVNGTTGWHTAFGTGDKFMRQRKGTGNWSAAIRLVGIDGTSGTDGRSVNGMTTEFYLSNSKTSRTGGSWVTEPPTWVNGKYLWTRVKIDYINPTSTAYTTPSVSSEWEAVNDLEIGGQNLALETNQGTKNWVWGMQTGGYTATEHIEDGISGAKLTRNSTPHSGWSYGGYKKIGRDKLERGETYMITLDVFTNKASTLLLYFRAANIQYELISSWDYKNNTCTANTWSRIVLKATLLQTFPPETNQLLYISGLNTDTNAYYIFRNLKIEKGNKRTNWSPAPEDVTAEITAAKQEALTAAGNAQSTANSANTAVGNLSGYVDGAFKDGVIDAAEAKAIEKYKNTLNEAMAKAESSYLKVYTNTYLSGTPKTALQNAKINLWGQRDTLIGAINTAIAGGTTTASQKTAVDNAFTSFNSLMSAFQNALEEANKAIQVKLDNIAKGYVDDLEIGGRNLIEKTNQGRTNIVIDSSAGGATWTTSEEIVDGVRCAKGTKTVSTVETWALFNLRIYTPSKFRANQQYAISFKMKPSFAVGNQTIRFSTTTNQGLSTNSGTYSLVAGEWNHVKLVVATLPDFDTILAGRPTVHLRLSIVGNSSTGDTVLLKDIMIEEGNKASAYAPAPEDVPSALEYLATAIEQVKGTTIEGGLVTTNLLMVKDTNKEIRGGMSGLEDNIGFWTGGTYQEALDGTAKTIFRKDGSHQLAGGLIKSTVDGDTQIGDVHVDAGGALLIKEGEDARVLLTKENISSLDNISAYQSETIPRQSHQTSAIKVYDFPATLNVLYSGSRISITGDLNYSVAGVSAYVILKVSVHLVHVATNYEIELKALSLAAGTDRSEADAFVVYLYKMASGVYKLRMKTHYEVYGPTSPVFNFSANGLMNVFFDGSSRITEIGSNGIGVIKDGRNYSFFGVENGVYKIVEKTTGVYDRPGVLLAGRMETGSVSKYWGAKYRAGSYREGNNIYRIHHNIGHVDYSVQLTPQLDARMWVIQRATTYCRVQASVATLDFDFAIFGDNK